MAIDVNEITKVLAKKVRRKATQMDIQKTRIALLDFLTELKFPPVPDAKSWEDILQIYQRTEEDEKLTEGVKVRFAFQLFTEHNQYLVSLMECMAEADLGNYILAVHVNWKNTELRKHKALEEAYGGHFDGLLKAKHTIWAQTLHDDELASALHAGIMAILGNELVGHAPLELIGEQVKPSMPSDPTFPSKKEPI